MIMNIANIAAAEKIATTNMLQWFIDEQVEE
jgi:ferritin